LAPCSEVLHESDLLFDPRLPQQLVQRIRQQPGNRTFSVRSAQLTSDGWTIDGFTNGRLKAFGADREGAHLRRMGVLES
jgi:hypothetical protein